MIKNDPNRSILKDHKKERKKLIPPLMQIPNVELVSFRDKMLPCLIWISAFFVRNNDKDAVRKPIEFLIKCNDILDSENVPPLVFLNNFNKLSDDQKENICNDSEIKKMTKFIWENTCHQSFLFNDYPLSFLFKEFSVEISKEEAINRLKKDVVGLLDRYCKHATKVQVAATVSMAATRKLSIGPNIELPDPNAVFISPDSDDAKEFVSFARANLNGLAGIEKQNKWSKSFWFQIFKLEGCQ